MKTQVVEMYGMASDVEYLQSTLLNVDWTTVGHGFADCHTDRWRWQDRGLVPTSAAGAPT